MKQLRVAHLWIGIVGFLAFLLTGQYMHWFLHHLIGMADGPRLLYRSSHIYLLWSSLLNILLGSYIVHFEHRLFRGIQLAGSLALLLGPILLLSSFFIESNSLNLSRPLARAAIYLALSGVLLHVISSALQCRKNVTLRIGIF